MGLAACSSVCGCADAPSVSPHRQPIVPAAAVSQHPAQSAKTEGSSRISPPPISLVETIPSVASPHVAVVQESLRNNQRSNNERFSPASAREPFRDNAAGAVVVFTVEQVPTMVTGIEPAKDCRGLGTLLVVRNLAAELITSVTVGAHDTPTSEGKEVRTLRDLRAEIARRTDIGCERQALAFVPTPQAIVAGTTKGCGNEPPDDAMLVDVLKDVERHSFLQDIGSEPSAAFVVPAASACLQPEQTQNPQDPLQLPPSTDAGVGSSSIITGPRRGSRPKVLEIESESPRPPRSDPARPVKTLELDLTGIAGRRGGNGLSVDVDVARRPTSLDSSDDVDDQAFLSVNWSIDAAGSLRHVPTGLQITQDKGVRVAGMTWRMSPEDIDVVEDSALGSGASGVVRLGVHKQTGTLVAMKTVRFDTKGKRDQMLRDIEGLIEAEGCPYLVQWYAGFTTADTTLVHVVLEFMDLGSLRNLRKRLAGDVRTVPPTQLACITAQMTRGLAFLQERSILHRDVKPENVLHNREGRVKLTDFGISKHLESLSMGITFVGTATYMSPERVQGEQYSYQSDVWSMGMVVYELSTGQHPYQSCSFMELYEKVCELPEPRLQLQGAYPAALCDFVARCLVRDAAARRSACALLDHEFVALAIKEACITSLASWLAKLMV